MLLRWEGQEFEAVEPGDMLLPELAACEKWHGVRLNEWGLGASSMSIVWVTLKRRFPQFARDRVEGLTLSQMDDMLVHDDEQDDEQDEAEPDPTRPVDSTPPAAG